MKFVFAVMAAAFLAVSAGSSMAAASGEKVFKRKCRACHSAKAGKNKVGPSLFGVYGRVAGKAPKYRYSKGMKAASAKGVKWDDKTLEIYLTNPRKYIKKVAGGRTKMTYNLRKAKDRDAVIGYLKTLK